jgi:hypothetical protein
VVTRETVREILGEAASERPPSDVDAGIAGGVGGPGGASAAEAVASGGSPVGVVTVPAWRPGTDASVLPQANRDVLRLPPVRESLMRQFVAAAVAAAGPAVTK